MRRTVLKYALLLCAIAASSVAIAEQFGDFTYTVTAGDAVTITDVSVNAGLKGQHRYHFSSCFSMSGFSC